MNRNISFPHIPSTEFANSQLLNTPPDTMDWLAVREGYVRGAQNRGIFSIHPAVFPSGTEWGLTHVNPWFIKKWIDLLLQSITVIKILATLLLPPSSPSPKWKVELKNTEADQDSKHAGTAWLHQEKKPASPLFRALRHHFWEVLLRQLTSSFRLPLQMCGFPAQWAPAALALFQVPLCDSNKRRSWKPSATAQL